MSTKNVTEKVTGGQDLERIREILFGQTIRDYDSRFSSVSRDAERMQKSIDQLSQQLAEQQAENSRKLQELRKEMRESEDSLRTELRDVNQRLTEEKMDKQVLGDLFIELGNQIKTGAIFSGVLEDLLGSNS